MMKTTTVGHIRRLIAEALAEPVSGPNPNSNFDPRDKTGRNRSSGGGPLMSTFNADAPEVAAWTELLKRENPGVDKGSLQRMIGSTMIDYVMDDVGSNTVATMDDLEATWDKSTGTWHLR